MILFILLFTHLCFAEDKARFENLDEKASEILRLLNDEEKLVDKLLQRRNHPKLYFRKLGVMSEKLKFYHKKENKDFLKASLESGKALKKDDYFKNTMILYTNAKSLGHLVIKRFPTFSQLADVYFLLGTNSRDYGKDEKAEIYLQQAVKISHPGSAIHFEAKATLADYYYNQKKYKSAISLYEFVIKNEKHQWFPKYNYNLAWCYIKTKYFRPAITKMRQAYFYSKKDGYIDVSDQVLANIGVFYAYADKVEDGIEFYLENAKDPIPYLHKMGSMLMERGLFNLSEMTLNRALKETSNRTYEIELKLSKLDLYRQFVKIESHYQTAQNLHDMYIKSEFEKELNEELTNKLNEFVNDLQLKVTKKLYQHRPDLMKSRQLMVINYFDMLSRVDRVNAANYFFFMGETYYALGDYHRSLPLYSQSFQQAMKDNKETKLKKQILDSTLATLGLESVSAEDRKTYLVPCFENYLSVFPQGEKSQSIYRKLFQNYRKRGDRKRAEDLIYLYAKNYPDDIKFQRGMVTSLIDDRIKANDPESLSGWIVKLQSGLLSFPKEVILKTEIVLGRLLFTQNQNMVKSGKSTEAIQRYIELYNNQIYTAKIKAKSAYNASILLAQSGKTQQALEWSLKSLPLFPEKDLEELIGGFVGLSQDLALQQDLNSSMSLSETILNKFCIKKEWKVLSRFTPLYLQNKILKKDHQFFSEDPKLNQTCPGFKKYFDDSQKQYLASFETLDNWEKFFSIPLTHWQKYGLEKQALNMAINMDDMRPSHDSKDYLGRALKLTHETEFKNAIEAKFQIRPIKDKITHLLEEKFDQDDEFQEAQFNSWLEKRVQNLSALTEGTKEILSKSNTYVAVLIYQEISTAYEKTAQQLLNITPLKKAPEYIKGFRQSMSGLAKDLSKKAKSFHWSAYKLAKDDLKISTSWQTTPQTMIPSGMRYSYKYIGLTFDQAREGR